MILFDDQIRRNPAKSWFTVISGFTNPHDDIPRQQTVVTTEGPCSFVAGSSTVCFATPRERRVVSIRFTHDARSHHARHHPPAHRIPRPLRASLRAILPRRVPRRWKLRGVPWGSVHRLLGVLEQQPVPGRAVLQLRVMCVRILPALSMPVPRALASSRPKPHTTSRPPLPLPVRGFLHETSSFPPPRSHLTFACSVWVRVTR